MKRKIWIAAAVICFFFVLLAVARGMIQSRLNSQAILQEISKTLGMTVKAGAVNLTWTGQVALLDAALSEEGQTFLKIREVDVQVRLLDLLKRKVSVQSISLNKPSLVLNERLAAILSQRLRKNKSTSQNFTIFVSGGKLAYTLRNGKTVALKDLAGNLGLSNLEIPVKFNFRDPNGGYYDISGKLVNDTLNLHGQASQVLLQTSFFQGKTSGQFNLAGNFSDVKLDSLLTVESKPFQGKVSLSGDLFPNSEKEIFIGKILSREGVIQDLGKFISLSFSFSFQPDRIVLHGGALELHNGTVGFSGKVAKGNMLTINASSTSFSPFSFSGLSDLRIQSSPGSFSGTVSGVFPNLSYDVNGSFPEAAIGKRSWKEIAFHAIGKGGLRQISFNPLTAAVSGVPLSAVGTVRWDTQQDFYVDFSQLDAQGLVRFFHVSRNLESFRAIMYGNVAYNNKEGTWNGNLFSSGGAVAGIPFESFGGKFSYAKNRPFAFSGSFQSMGKPAAVNGEWENGVGKFSLDANGIPVRQVPFAGKALAGFSGEASIHANFSTAQSGSQVRFSVVKCRYKQKPFPDPSGTLVIQGSKIRFDPLSFPGMKPPLALTGEYDGSTRQASFQGSLNGQNPQALLSLFSSRLPTIGGLLYGNFALSGIFPKLLVSFSGDVRNIYFQNITIPAGKLTLHGSFPDQLSFHFQTDQFSLGQIAPLHQFVPIDGTGSLVIDSAGINKGMNVLLHFPKTSLNARDLGPLDCSLVYSPPLIQVRSISFSVSSVPVLFSGGIDLTRKSVDLHASLNGEGVSDLAQLLGKSSNSLEGNLYGNIALRGTIPRVGLSFSGNGKNLSFSGTQVGSANLSAQVIPSETGYEIQAKAGLAVSHLDMVQKGFPGLTGDLEVNLLKSGSMPPVINFDLRQAVWKGKPFARIAGKLTWQPPLAVLSPISLESLSPPLALNGNFDTEKHLIQLDGDLQGQTVASLLALAGSADSQVNARLYGPLSITGSSDSPDFHFAGKVTDLVYRGLHLGNGRLVLEESRKALAGKLTIDKPIVLDPQQSLLGSLLQSIPKVGGIYGQFAAGKMITGVLIRGTVQHPDITPNIEQTSQSRAQNNTPRQWGQPAQKPPNNNIFNIILNGGKP